MINPGGSNQTFNLEAGTSISVIPYKTTEESNFMALLHLGKEDCDVLNSWLVRNYNYTSHVVKSKF